jgi:hypothetical protein
MAVERVLQVGDAALQGKMARRNLEFSRPKSATASRMAKAGDRRDIQIAAASDCHITNGRTDGRGATSSAGDGDIRSSKQATENRWRWLLCRLNPSGQPKRRISGLGQEDRRKVRRPQESVFLCSRTFPPQMRPYRDTARGFRRDLVNSLNFRSDYQMFRCGCPI